MLEEPAQDGNLASMTPSRSNRAVPARNGADEVNGARGGVVADDAAAVRQPSAHGNLGEVPVDSSDEIVPRGGREGPTGAAGGARRGVGGSNTHADGDDGVGAFDVGATGAGANGDSTNNDAGLEDGAGAGDGAHGGPASGARTTRERGQPRGRVATEMFTKEELKTFFLDELRVTLGLSARQSIASGVWRLHGRFVNGAQVMVLTELMDPVVVWTRFADGAVLAFCSCGKVMATGQTATADEIEPVDLQVALGESSSCRHAVAILEAYDCLCVDVRAGSLDELTQSCPALLGSDDGIPVEEDDTVVLFSMLSGKRNNIPVYVVYHMGVWSPAVVWQQGNRHRLTTCCLVSCKTQPWACIHAKAVNHETRSDRTSSSQAVVDTMDAMQLGANGVLDDGEQETVAQDPDPPTAVAVAAAAAAAAVEASMRPRRARNMFPCVKEVEMCDRYAGFVEEERESPGDIHFTDFLHVEDECFACDDRWTESTVCKSTLATLFTIRGRLAIITKSWTCSRGHHVAYDGSADGLFAFRPETVYTRVFLDSIIELCVIARSTLAAASEFLASFLRNTAAFAEGEPGQARQQLSDACGEFCDTLVVPKVAFVCHRCGEDEAEGGSFHCIVCDGQILSVLQENVVSMLRPGMNAPRVDFALTFACSVRHAAPRRVIRNRVRAKPADDSALTKAEAEVWPAFAAVADGLPPAPPSLPRQGPPRTDAEKQAAALWAASVLVGAFCRVEVAQPQQPARAEPVGTDDAGEEPGALREEDGEVVDLVGTSGSDGEEGGDWRVDEARRVARARLGTDGRDDDADSSLLGQADGWLHAQQRPPAPAPASPSNAPPLTQEQMSAALQRVVLRLQGAPHEAGTAGLGATAEGRSRATPGGQQAVSPGPDDPAPPPSPSAPSLPPLAVDPGRDELATDDVARTASPWRTPLTSTAAGMGLAALGQGSVVLDCRDPASPLTEEALERTQAIVDATNDDHLGVVVTIDNVPLNVPNLQRTVPGQWFTDEVINGYINLLRRRQADRRRADGRAQRMWFFNTFFYSRMHVRGSYNYHLVARWCGRLNLLSFDLIFVPINVANSHWVLAVMHPRTGVINVYDSLSSSNAALVPSLKRWTVDHARDVGVAPVDWRYIPVRSRQQENSDDCGVFMVTAMDYLARGLPLSSRRASTHYYRRRICASLLAGQL